MTQTSDPKPLPLEPVESPQQKKKRNYAMWWLTLGLLVLGIIWFLVWFFYLQFHESTDDAYANGNLVNINSVVSSSVVAFYADDTDLVKEGQLLAVLDNTDFQIRYDRELATLASVVLQVRQLYDQVKVNQAVVESKRVAFQKANYDYQNRSKLVESEAISNEDYTHSKDDLRTAELDLKQAAANLQLSIDAAGNTPIELHPNIIRQKAIVKEAYYQLQHCSIFAPTTGYVAQRTVDVGQWVMQNSTLMAIIPTDYVWVDANFKETQLTYMRIGQPAEVWFDLYGSKIRFDGEVMGIASGSGSVFSLIPPQNATGNWIKIVQRLPVRISLNPKVVAEYPVRLGISAEVNVNISNQDLPRLAQKPIHRPIATTDIFNLNFEKVDTLMQEIIQQQLKSEPA